MPRSDGLRDDDILGRLAEIETRLDGLEAPRHRRTALEKAEDETVGEVPSRDERRDAEPRAEQLMIAADRDPDPGPFPPDSFHGAEVNDPTVIVPAEDREAAEADLDEATDKAERTAKRQAAARRKAADKKG